MSGSNHFADSMKLIENGLIEVMMDNLKKKNYLK